jgi:hypothetical protein
MKHLLTLLLAICAATGYGQTIKTLGFNTTNGQIVANTGTNVLTFTNERLDLRTIGGDGAQVWDAINNTFYFDLSLQNSSISFVGTNAAAAASTTRANLGFSTNLNTFWTATNSSNARSAVGLGATWLTNTNVTNFRSAIGLGATNEVTFEAIVGGSRSISVVNGEFMGAWYFDDSVSFGAPNVVRTNLGLGLPALTNTSNVTAIRALSGSTNTNHPYSGSISVVGTNNTNTLVFSNGILQEVQ